MNSSLDFTYRIARRIAVATIGGTILIIGFIMLLGPGPGIVVIPIGLAILAAEFAWARSWLSKLRRGISANGARDRGQRAERHRSRNRV